MTIIIKILIKIKIMVITTFQITLTPIVCMIITMIRV